MELRGVFFLTDALIAAFLLMALLMSASSFYVYESPREDISFFAQDLVNVLSHLSVGEVNSTYVKGLIADGNITNLNNTLLEQIGVFWAEGHDQLAADFTDNIIGPLIPAELSVGIWIDSNLTYITNNSNEGAVTSFRKFISGIERDKPVEGHSARIYLKGINSRRTTAYSYFGGFTGQGNITNRLWLADNITQFEEAFLEVDASGDFDLYFNGNYVDSYTKGTGGGGYMEPDRWYVDSAHYPKLQSGTNDITLVFDGLGYVAGGFLSVTYSTGTRQDSEVVYTENTSSIRYWFPGIEGIINLYDAVTVPGTLTSMEVHLHFNSEHSTYLTIGSTTVYTGNGSAVDQTIDLMNMSDFPYSLNFGQMSNSTVPVRLASYNITAQNITGSNGDIILITDLSGSMRWQIGSWDETNGVIRTCGDSQLYSSNDSRRISVAKCLDINFTNIIMSSTGNREWLVDFEESASYFSSDPADLTLANLVNRIVSYPDSPSGGTCLCCAINLAYDILNAFSTVNRSRHVVILTDGIPTYCCGRDGWWTCANGTSTSRRWPIFFSSCSGGQSDCNTNDCDGPINNAIWSAERLVNDFNPVIHTVGMGPIVGCQSANHTLKRIAEIGNGTFNASQDAQELLKVFQGIADSIMAEINQSDQEIIVKGNITPSILYSDSYIEMNYTPIVPEPEFGRITVTAESASFGNNVSNATLQLPSVVQLLTLHTTSYSAEKWTDNVSIADGSWQQVFSLSDSFVDYTRLGDPFVVMIPADLVAYGTNNTVTVSTGTGPENTTGGSPANRLVYSMSIPNSVGYSGVYATAVGCNWSLQYDDGTNGSIMVPSGYDGTKQCDYTAANYSQDDAIDQAAYTLFSYLDFDGDGRLAVKIGDDDVEIDSMSVSEVPSMWGPSIFDLRVWK